MSTAVIYGEILLLEYGARPTDAAGRMLVNKFKFYERVIKLGSNSRKYHKEATGNKKEGRKSTPSAGEGKILQEGNIAYMAAPTRREQYVLPCYRARVSRERARRLVRCYELG